MHGCCDDDDDDDAMIFALGIGGITSNPSQITSQANKKSGERSSNQVYSTSAVSFPGSQPPRVTEVSVSHDSSQWVARQRQYSRYMI